MIRLLRRPWSLLGPHQVGAPSPTTAPAPSPAPGHPGHHLHHPGHHSHHPSRHLHHPGPQEGGGGQVDPGQIPGLQVSQDSIFHLPFAPLSNPPPGHPRGTWTPRQSYPYKPHCGLRPQAAMFSAPNTAKRPHGCRTAASDAAAAHLPRLLQLAAGRRQKIPVSERPFVTSIPLTGCFF